MMGVTTAIGTLGVGAVATTANFEDSMRQVAATMGITASEIENGSESYTILENAAKECGEKTKYSASEAAEALNYMALAGYDAKQSAETLPKVLNLAAAGNLDLATASDMVTDAMAALGMQTSDLDKYIDEMAKTSQKSNTSVAQLGEATLTCAGTVKMSGMSLETMNTELGILANNGIKGAEGGTHLRNIILSLTSPTDTAATALKTLGINVLDSSGNVRDMNDIMTDFNKKLNGLSDGKKTEIISQIFNKTDISAVNALIKGSGEEFANLKSQVLNCDGAAQNMADTMNSSLKGQLTLLKSQIEGIAIKIGNKLMPIVKKIVSKISDLATKFSNLSDEQLETILKIGGVVAALGPLLIILGKTVIGIGNTITAFGKITKAISNVSNGIKMATGLTGTFTKILGAITSPVGLATIAIGGLTAGIYALLKATGRQIDEDNIYYESTQKLIDKHKELTDELQNNIESRQTTIEKTEEEVATADILFEKLQDLMEVENKTNAQKEIMKGLVEDLNEILPDLNLQYDDEKDKLNLSTEAIRNNISAQQDLLKAKAAQELLSPILADIAKAEIENSELVKQNEQNEKAYQQAFQDRKNIMLNIQEQGGKMTKEQKKQLEEVQTLEETLKAAYDKSSTALAENESTLKSLNSEYDKTKGYAENLFNQAELEQKLGNLTTMANNAGVQIPEAVKTGIRENQYAVPQSIEELQRLINFDNALQSAKIAGVTIPEDIKQGIMNGSVNVQDAVAQLGQEMNRINKQEADKMPEEMKNAIGRVAQTFNDDTSVQNAAGEVGRLVKGELAQNIDAYNSGADATSTFADGLENQGVIGKLRKKLESVANTVRSFLHFSVPDEGPLSDADTYMPDMIDLLSNTMIKETPKLEKATLNIAKMMSSNLNFSNLNTGFTLPNLKNAELPTIPNTTAIFNKSKTATNQKTDLTSNNVPKTAVINMIINGRQVAQATAPFDSIIQGTDLKLSERGLA